MSLSSRKKMKLFVRLVAIVLLAAALSSMVFGQSVDIHDTRLLTLPAVSKKQIAFSYADDLWVADLDGKNVRRLTTNAGVQSKPWFSPDGSLIAFSAQYDGNVDVYVVAAAGGVPKRLTWHPRADIAQGFTPDGKAVLFTSPRNASTLRYENVPTFTQLFTVPVEGGPETLLEIPHAFKATYSPDGSRMAYNPLYEAFDKWMGWKHYRGGTASLIQLYRFSDHSLEKIPQPLGRSNDVDPMWMGDTIYFRSDRNGEFNLFSFEVKTRVIKQLTWHKDFPIVEASCGNGQIIYEQAGYLHLYDPAIGKSSKLTIGVSTDLPETRVRYAKGSKFIRHASLSPTGARIAFEFRGEIVAVPEEKGDPRNLTQTPGVNERSPAWSPDGRSIAYFSDESGEYELHVRGQDGKGEVRKFKLTGAGFYEDPVWAPDSLKIAYTDNSWSLYWIDLKTGANKKIGSEYRYGHSRAKSMAHVWSPDSKWLAYTLDSKAIIQTVYLYSVDQDKSFAVTDGLSEVSEPVFDENGMYLYFFASTDAGPVKDWFEMTNADMRVTRSVYLAVLRKDLSNPLAKESDEEKGIQKEGKPQEKVTAKSPERMQIDFEGLNHRIVSLPIPAGNYRRLQVGSSGQIYFLEDPPGGNGLFRPVVGKTSLHRYDLDRRKDETLLSDVSDDEVSFDKKKMLCVARDVYTIVTTANKPQPGQAKVNTDGIEVRVDPRAEWTQMFNEAWRINRDYFYDPNMHGVDWNAMRAKYSMFLPDLSCRADLNRVLIWMLSELYVGHASVAGGDFLIQPKIVPGGLLGADFTVENGRYRFEKVYGGLNWNPELQSPLTEPGVDVKAGEYLLAVEGKDLRSETNLYSMFEGTAGKIIEITVGPDPGGASSRNVSVVPIADEMALRNLDWVEGNIRKVDEATGGRVAYVYVPDTYIHGHDYFKRYFFPQSYKDGIIVDERFNSGGLLADYIIDLLRRPVSAYWALRYGADLKTPLASMQGPKVMIIDETAGSGGDFLPFVWRRLKMGPLVGKRTWGGLVGQMGFPPLMDGGGVSAPNVAIFTEDGWVVENEGVPPDVEVEQSPADVINGHDPQLEKAIQIVMDELKKNPPKTPRRPPYPIKNRQ